MPPTPVQVLADASVIIDLHKGDLLEAIGGLSFRVTIPDVIVEHELLKPSGKDLLEAGWIDAREIPGDEIVTVQAIQAKHRALTFYDASALHLAQTMAVPLLTRDRPLERVAKQYGIEILDTTWLLEQMLEERVVKPGKVAMAVVLMQSRGNPLPEDPTKALLARWDLPWNDK